MGRAYQMNYSSSSVLIMYYATRSVFIVSTESRRLYYDMINGVGAIRYN